LGGEPPESLKNFAREPNGRVAPVFRKRKTGPWARKAYPPGEGAKPSSEKKKTKKKNETRETF